MVNIIVDSTYLDTFGDQGITLTKRSKDARELNNLFADYSNTFTLPATQTNNKIFKHYYNFNVIGGYDARIKTPARLEIDSYPLQDGLLRLDECVIKEGKIDTYKVTFYGNTVNLSDLFGENTLDTLNLSAYNHVRDITNVVAGLGSGSLLSDDVIYPLISKDNNWTKADLSGTGTDVIETELSPAVRVKKVIDQIATDYNLTFTSDFFDDTDPVTHAALPASEAHFNKMYLWCPRELDTNTSAIIDANGSVLPFEVYTNQYASDVSSGSLGILQMTSFDAFGYTEGRAPLNFTPSTADTYDIKMFGKNNAGLWIEHQTFTGQTGTNLFNFVWSDTDNYTAIRFYVDSVNPFTADYTIDIDYQKGVTWDSAVDVTSTVIPIDNYQAQLRYKIPSMRIIDFLGGIIKMFNLMITPISATEFDFEPYDVWITEGSVRDLTQYLDFASVNILTPKLPKEVSYKYNEPKAILNNQYNQIVGSAYGDAIAKTDGTDAPKSVKVEFENMLWGILPGGSTNYHVGFSFEEPNNGFEDRAFLMYWSHTVTSVPSPLYIGTGINQTALTSYKLCNSYYPDTGATTHSLNFDSELNSYDYTLETVSLFEDFHKEYISKIFHEALRMHKVKMRLPLHVMRDIDIKDTVKLDDLYYNINLMSLDLIKETATFELINFVRELSSTTVPIDTEAPIIGELSIVANPDTTAPTIGVLSASNITGDSIRLNWTAATDDVGVTEYQIYQDTVHVKSILGGYLTTNITGLSNLTSYDFYITATDAASNTSAASNTVTQSTLDVNAPVITSPVTTWWYIPSGGEFKSYQITATNTPNLYGATGVPGFLTFTAATGTIAGTVQQSDAGNYPINVRASNTAGVSWGEYQEIIIVVIPS